MSGDERLALADKIKYAIDTEGKITLYASHGRMAEAAIRQSSERDAVVEECARICEEYASEFPRFTEQRDAAVACGVRIRALKGAK